MKIEANTGVLLGLLPLLIFVIVDSFAGLTTALVTAVVVGVAEMVFSQYYFGEIDLFSWLSFGMIVVMSVVSWKTQNSRFFKWGPVVLSLFFGGFLVATTLMGQPYLSLMVNKYLPTMAPDKVDMLLNPFMQAYWARLNWTLGIAFFFHAALTAYAAEKLSNWVWIAVRGIGLYLFMGIATVITMLSLR